MASRTSHSSSHLRPGPPRDRQPARADRERMAFVEGRLAGQARVDRYLQPLRQRAQLRHGASGQDPGSGPDERILRPEQGVDRRAQIALRRPMQCRRGRAVVPEFFRHRLRAHVVRHLHHHRTRTPVAQRMEGTTHLRPDLIDVRHHFGRLQHRAPGAGGREIRTHIVPVERVALGQNQDRNVVGPRPVRGRRESSPLPPATASPPPRSAAGRSLARTRRPPSPHRVRGGTRWDGAPPSRPPR